MEVIQITAKTVTLKCPKCENEWTVSWDDFLLMSIIRCPKCDEQLIVLPQYKF